jgi:hypothetical protein
MMPKTTKAFPPLPFHADVPSPRQPKSLDEIQAELFPGFDGDHDLGFLARAFIASTLPHSPPRSTEFIRESKKYYRLTLLAPSELGLPFGVYPRRALVWLTTTAARLKSPTLSLGASLSNFAYLLGITPTSSTMPQLRDQLCRLLETTVSCRWDNTADPNAVNPSRWSPHGFRIAFSYHLWGSPEQTDPSIEFPNFIRLSKDFYDEIVDRPVPIDLNVIKTLRSPMAIDVYCWLCWRSLRQLRLGRPDPVSWESLENQFGADYGEPRVFRFHFKKALASVFKVYPEVRVEATKAGLRLYPYPPHIPVRAAAAVPRLIKAPTKR